MYEKCPANAGRIFGVSFFYFTLLALYEQITQLIFLLIQVLAIYEHIFVEFSTLILYANSLWIVNGKVCIFAPKWNIFAPYSAILFHLVQFGFYHSSTYSIISPG